MKRNFGAVSAISLSLLLGAFVVGASAQTLAEALDQPTWTFTTGGNANWYGETATTHDGSDAAQSGAITNSQSTWMQTTQTFASSGYVVFYWRVSSENDYDYLTFYIDGVEQAKISGEVSWQHKGIAVGSGAHTLKWVYSKDDLYLEGQDTGWVDEVAFVPGTTPYTLTVQSASPDSGVSITVSPLDRNSAGDGTTPFTRSYYVGQAVTLTAPLTSGGNNFISWTGCDSVAGVTCTVTPLADRTVQAQYSPPIGLAEAVDQPTWTFATSGNANWFGQVVTTHDGSDAARSGIITDGQATAVQTTYTFPATGYVAFVWKVSSEWGYDLMTFYIDDVEQAAISGEVAWQEKTFPVNSGTHTLKWEYSKDANLFEGADAAWVDQVLFVDLAEAVDQPTWTFATGGNADWFSQNVTTSDGSDAGQSGIVTDSQTSWMATTRTIPAGGGYLIFSWKVSSEQDFDLLTFLIDDIEQAAISGETAWRQQRFPIGSGAHTFRWAYSKNVNQTEGLDTGWVDGIRFISRAKNDFDGDGRSDIGCYYPTGGNWYGFNSTTGFWQTQFGYEGTLPITGDFDGDGRTDFGCYYAPLGKWYVYKSAEGFWETQFGYDGTIPVVGDFDGDGRDDIGCYYPTGGNWYVFKSTEGFWQTTFGYKGTIPVVGDFDGDGRDDIGCYYAAGGNWYVFKSTEGFWETQFGYDGTIPIAGDFDGDSRDDIGCYYTPGGNWYVFQSTAGFWQTQFGYDGTEPVVGDFDGDGRDDIGCYYATGGNWYVFQSTAGFWQTQFGYSGTIPLGGTLR